MNKKQLLIAVAASAMLLTAAADTHHANAAGNTYAAQLSADAQIFSMINEYRTARNLAPLKRSAELDRAAAVRAHEISQHFSHTRPDGRSWSTVSSAALGENIAYGHRTAEKAMLSWMNSPGHRANILRSGFGSVGIAAVNIGGRMYWVQLFGR